MHTVKGFRIDKEAEVDFWREFPWFCYDAPVVGNLISGSSAFFFLVNWEIQQINLHLLPSLWACNGKCVYRPICRIPESINWLLSG